VSEEALKQQVEQLKSEKAHLLGLLQQVVDLENKVHPVVLTPSWYRIARNAISGVYPKLFVLPKPKGDA